MKMSIIDCIQNIYQAPFKCLSAYQDKCNYRKNLLQDFTKKMFRNPMNPCWIWKAKLERFLSFSVQSGKITVCSLWQKKENKNLSFVSCRFVLVFPFFHIRQCRSSDFLWPKKGPKNLFENA